MQVRGLVEPRTTVEEKGSDAALCAAGAREKFAAPPPALSMIPERGAKPSETSREHSAGQPLSPSQILTLDLLPRLWNELKETVLFYHGTSEAFLASIKEHGLSGAIKPIEEAKLDLFYEVYRRVNGEPHPLEKNNHHSNPTVFVSGKKADAEFYASRPSEVLGIVADRIPELLERGKEMISPAERGQLLEVLEISKKLVQEHTPVLLEIKGLVLEELAKSQGISVLDYLRKQLSNLSGKVTVADFLDAVFREENEIELPPVPAGMIKNLG